MPQAKPDSESKSMLATNLPLFTTIPTQDPDSAVRFCQNLSRILAEKRDYAKLMEIETLIKEAAESVAGDLLTHPDLSVVIPIYNEEDNIFALHSSLSEVLENTGMNYEIIFVDDGSYDNSKDLLRETAAKDRHVTVVELARNFGHQIAITAGLDHSQGKAVVVMDGDFQDPPELLPHLIAKWREGCDVVYGQRKQRREGWIKRTTAAAFYRLLKRVASIEIPLDTGDFCLMDRRVVTLLAGMPERNRFIRGIRSWVGLKQVGIAYDRPERHAGQTKYTFGRMVLLALDGLISFSHTPLRIASLSGFVISVLSLFLATFYLLKKLTTGLGPPGFATLVVAIFFLAGIQLITIGVMGEYVGRIFDEVKRRPLYVVRQIINNR